MEQTQTLEDKAYRENPTFWTRKGDELTVMGDFLGRMPSIDLISAKPGEVILDAGCGAGFISRRLAKQGAKVHGCDRNSNMINQAMAEEKQSPVGIEYCQADIVKLPYESGKFDKAACIAVLIHDSPQECLDFFKEAKRTLKKEGKLVLSLMHPALYLPGSPNRTGRASWAQYKPVDNISMDQSQRFVEDYRNSKGDIFTSTVWYHPEKVLTNLLAESGLEVLSSHTQYVSRDALIGSKQTGEVGYPGFLQIVARKEK